MAPPIITTLGGASTRGFGQGAGGGKVIMPSGIIIPFTGASTPTGWSSFSSADDRAIVGAGSTYSAGDTGGSSSFSIAAGTMSNAGSHTGPSGTFCGQSGGSGGPGKWYSGGSHSHDIDWTGTGDPQYRKYKLIKASDDHTSVPAGGVLLGEDTISGDGVSNIDSGNNGIMYGGASVANGGNNTLTLAASTTNSGGHQHGNGYVNLAAEHPPNHITAGAHSHNGSTALYWNVKRRIMTAWSNALADFEFEGSGVAMWESATPPEDWLICDGTSGTPDLRDYFVQIGDTGTHGTTSGTNTHSYDGASVGNSVYHNHNGGGNGGYCNPFNGYHAGYSWSHSHNIGGGSTSQLPPYYGLYFVQYAG